MRSARWLIPVVALSLAALLIAACGGGGDNDNDAPPGAPSNDRDNDGIKGKSDDCPDEREDNRWSAPDESDGCPDDFDDLVELARADVNEFWTRTFEEEGDTYEEPRTFEAYSEEIETECGKALLNNAFYCLPEHGIYFHREFMERELKTNGDFAVAFIIAHEWGHLVQGLVGILDRKVAGQLFTIQTELQADCLAGVWARDADDRRLLERGDIEEGIVALFRVGDPLGTPAFDPRAHGSAGQRIDAFQKGFQQGLGGCRIE
jgi:hypothetical protein